MKTLIFLTAIVVLASCTALRKPSLLEALAYCPEVTGTCIGTKCPNGGTCVKGQCCNFEKAQCMDKTWNCPSGPPCDPVTAQKCQLSCGLCNGPKVESSKVACTDKTWNCPAPPCDPVTAQRCQMSCGICHQG